MRIIQPAISTSVPYNSRTNGAAALLVLLAILCVAISIGSSRFYALENIVGTLRQCALVLIVGSGMTQLLIAAEVDLSVGASLAFSGVVAMDVTNRTGSVLLGAAAGILFGGLVGLVNGIIVTRLKVKSLIATIATMMILQGSVFLYSHQAIQNGNQLPAFGRDLDRLYGAGADACGDRGSDFHEQLRRAALHSVWPVHLCRRRKSASRSALRS